MGNLVCARAFATRSEAELGKSLLEAEGIPSVLAVGDVGTMRPEVAFTTGGAKLLVDVADLERANDLLAGLGIQRMDAAEFRALQVRAAVVRCQPSVASRYS